MSKVTDLVIDTIFKDVLLEIQHSDLQTGDLLFFCDSKTWYNKVIDWATNSDFCHIGMVVKNPNFSGKQYNGLYVIHSTSGELLDIEDNKHKLGVQLTKFVDTIKQYESVFIRRLTTNRNTEFYKKLDHAHTLVHDIPYDFNIKHWLVSAFYHWGIWDQKVKRHTNSFWCSALVGFLYVNMDLLPKDFDWSNWAPCDFSENRFTLINNSALSDITLLYTH